MFSHIMLGANDLEASKAFYDAVLGELEQNPVFYHQICMVIKDIFIS